MFGPSRGVLRQGTVKVSIPLSHKVGRIERPSLQALGAEEDPNKHIVLLEVKGLALQEFSAAAAAALLANKEGRAFVFVHGYKTTFEQAALRTAQMAADFEFKLVPAFYSWPSQGALAKYIVDAANAEWAEMHLAEFLRVFAEGSRATEIVVIAHSMGGRVATRAMNELLQQHPELRPRFRELVLAAPDDDADTFKNDILPRIQGAGPHVTLYASSNDKALKASKGFNGNPRSGEAGATLVLAAGLETIDASGIDTDFLGHSYFAETRPLLTDLSLLLNNHLSADQRPLLAVREAHGMRYWALRP
jgi:esterase/lipase superfamily enzyme